VPYHLTAGVAANVPDELGRGVHRPFISGFTCTSLFPKVVQWSVEVLGAWCLVLRFVSTCDAQVPFAPRGPGARANVCDSDASTFPSSPAHLSARHMARVGEAPIVLRLRRSGAGAATAALSADMDMVRRVGSSSVWTWVGKLYVSFATAPLLPLRYICNRTAPRGQIVTTAQVTRQTRYKQHTCLLTPLAYTHKEDLPGLALTLG